ncbi:hydroxymethylbilane synthase [Lutibacter sp. TH_r2]|uniref:hydroxymethylbilane synthase n=1 Tax=Lutibacter sp. TH_r2 TaxID=3082083 RepID=UPI0029534DEB|nr:hydroxymethylbilane synthase [Lutibacter sp. TH_r2]MDV7187124.1 hydroxymethylbilane synthase [Lutibacter sp. TH_r2]
MNKIRIGTRSSELALWQANTVAHQLETLGHETEIVKIDSLGDVVLDKPLYELGITGVFTRNLDIALLNNKVDIAVHSFKDVPTKLAEGIVQAAVLKRGDFSDILVIKDDVNFFDNHSAIVATGSLRRKAQWLYRYPNHTITGLRGNIQTRLQKLEDNDWDGAIFAAAGLKRMKLLPEKQKGLKLDWMVPAPAQGAVMVAALGDKEELLEILKEINHEETALCVGVEREFLRLLEGGCTAPIGAMAMIIKDEFKFKGVLFSPDGKHKMEYSKEVDADRKDKIRYIAEKAANYIIDRGGKKLMRPEIEIEKEINVFSTKFLSQDQANSIDVNINIEMRDFISIRNNRLKPIVVKNPIKNVVITSQNAVEALLSSFSSLELNFENIYCVGKRTKRLIERRIGKVAKVESSAAKLAKYLVENLEEKEVTFFCGNKRREELPLILEANNITVNEVECYQTNLTPKKLDNKFQGLLFFSPSAVESYLLENKVAENEVAFCIGDTTATEAKKHFKTVKVAKLATVESVLKSVNEYEFKN